MNAGLVYDFLFDDNFFDLLFLNVVLALIVGVALDVEFDESFKFVDFVLEAILVGNHLFLSVIRLNLSLLDLLLELNHFVKLLLLVAEFSSLRGDKEVLGSGEVELELVVVVHLVGLLLGFVVGGHF
jgi:hypothetical protein